MRKTTVVYYLFFLVCVISTNVQVPKRAPGTNDPNGPDKSVTGLFIGAGSGTAINPN
ncbi:hypothetical protein [Flavobacterium branchiicola]|uniref:Uncharacterized protein n=1 Tax=Flavobacterium branchiicola TaxID=1114875 RepID=A0ABV9PNV8_9FLAO|nr:hypothetical protein [Flavobacterium branchiicola]MBS7256760.1 hypothetical protein [Flavobacterium branchiicola]